MNKQFTDEQIKTYASQFREGDAIWCNNRWQKVVKGADGGLVVNPNDNHYLINNGEDFGFNARLLGFSGVNKNPFRVTALRGYELQGGEKIVWLGESESRKQFGECFNVFRYSNSFVYQNKVGYTFLVSGDAWGVIPSYEQVKQIGQIKKETENYKNILQKDINSIPNAEDLLIERSELLDTARTFLQHINKDIRTNSFKGSTTIHLSTFLVSHKAREVKNIIETILKEKGYEVKSSFKVEQEGYSSIEYISTISFTIHW